jgi:hypothetical protein
MSPPSVRQPGDVVNEVYSQNIKSIIDMCVEAGDDPSSLIEETKHELQVKEKTKNLFSYQILNHLENGYRNDGRR